MAPQTQPSASGEGKGATLPLGVKVSSEARVVVHPVVLLSVVDHYNRVCRNTSQRAVGVLLGAWKGKDLLDVSSSFAVPFEEDAKNPGVWFLDHDYLTAMFDMFRKVNARERVIGWYHTGPKLRSNDININEVIRRFVPNPVLVVIDAVPKELGLPTRAYVSVEEIHDDGTPTSKTFAHLGSEIGAEEAEEVGVEHLLRDIKDIGESGTLSHRIQHNLSALKGLDTFLGDINEYLTKVVEGKIPVNHQISYLLQDIFNLLPNVDFDGFVKSLSVKTSDQLHVVFVASLIRSTLALHSLIDNKLENRLAEQKSEQSELRKEKEKEAKEGDGDKDGAKGDNKADADADAKPSDEKKK
eukprot:m.481902 g.481902  ORF g.481902 m.481902 type:complete len:355 (-) comp22371_c0_seq1:38-1102(-)